MAEVKHLRIVERYIFVKFEFENNGEVNYASIAVHKLMACD